MNKKVEIGDEMAKNTGEIVKLSPAFVTGGGGENFEKHVAAVFVLSLIIDGLSPIVEAPIQKLEFQAKNRGYDVDDFVVTAMRGEKIKKLLCQVKHDVTITASNNTFQEVITAAWSDFNKSWFNRKSDMIALITSFIAKDSIDALRYLHDQAHACISAEDFATRLNQPNYTSKVRKEKYDAIKECIRKANGDEQATDEELWMFCRCFVLAVFDLDYEQSVNQTLIHSLIKCKANTDAKLVWARITEKSSYWKQAAATVTKESIPDDIWELFGKEVPEETTLPLPPAFSPSASWAIAALIGAWKEDNANDIRAIEKLTGTSYDLFQSECRQCLNTGMISLVNGQWKVINRIAVLDAVWDWYFDDTLQNAFQIATEFLKETSKQFSEDGKYGLLIPASGRFANSEGFRKGLLEGLCILSNGRKPAYSSDYLLERESRHLVVNVLENCDWIRIVSLGDLILYLGEISPNAYLNSLEKLIHNTPYEVLQLFPKKRSSFSDQNFITYLLFSLEQLAWHEDYLVQTITCLSALEAMDYEETNWANTPMNSMVSILNPFVTQTSAPLVKFKSAIQAIKVDYPEICWNLCCSMVSGSCINGMTNNSQPKYLMRPEKCNATLSGEQRDELREYYIHQALSMVGTMPDRMKRMVKNLLVLPSDARKTVLANIRTASAFWNDDEKGELWSKLTDWKCRIILDNDNKEPTTPEFTDLCTTIDAVRPGNSLSRFRRLFKFHYDEFSDSENRWEKKEQQKQEAVMEIYRTYGIHSLMEFGESLNAEYDIGYRLGQQITAKDMCNILPLYKTVQHEVFFANVINAFFKKNGMVALQELGIPSENLDMISFVLQHSPFTQELIDLVPVYLPENEGAFWEKVRISPYYYRHADYDVISVTQILMQYHRTPAAISLIGDAVGDLQPDPQLICNMLVQAPNEQDQEKIDPDSTRELIKYLQDSGAIEMETLSQIEFFYLVWLDEHSTVKPRAIEYLLANRPACFCELMAAAYKRRHAESEVKTIPKAIGDRLFQITFRYSIIPGTDWDGKFHSDVFENWMKEVVEWSKENDRFEVSMHTIGNALSYVEFNAAGLIESTIMDELNKIDNEELRKGYKLGIFNQRGVHWVDPEGKPEKELSAKYRQRAEAVEVLGYSRFALLLRSISDRYQEEAEDNIRRYSKDDEIQLTDD